MGVYYKNRERANIVNNEPTMTDQSGAAETDINVIVRNFMKHGEVEGAASEPIYGDFTELPNNLRDFMELARQARHIQQELPEQLRGIELEELFALTPQEIKAIIEPPKQTEEQA